MLKERQRAPSCDQDFNILKKKKRFSKNNEDLFKDETEGILKKLRKNSLKFHHNSKSGTDVRNIKNDSVKDILTQTYQKHDD